MAVERNNMNKPWGSYMEPFRIKGNLYFVGCYAALIQAIRRICIC